MSHHNTRPLTDSEIAYIRENHHNTPTKVMAKHLGRADLTIRKYMVQNGLTICKKVRGVSTESEFFQHDKNWIV